MSTLVIIGTGVVLFVAIILAIGKYDYEKQMKQGFKKCK